MTFLAPFRAPFQNPFPKEGAAAAATYAEILRDTYGASEVWPLVDISSGTNIPAFINSNRDGTLTGWDLQNAAGPVPTSLAPYSDGVNDTGNLFSASLNTDFNFAIGSIFMWIKPSSGAWTDGVTRGIFRFLGTNLIQITKSSANNSLQFTVQLGSGNKTVTLYFISDTNWFSVGISWKDSANGDSAVAYLNGSAVGSPLSGFSTATSGLNSSFTRVMATQAAAERWDGWGCYLAVKFGSIWSPTDFSNMHNDAATAGAD